VATNADREAVVDASVAVNLALPGHPYHPQARRLLADLADAGIVIIAPPLYESEADSTLRRLVHLGALEATAGAAAQAILDAIPMMVIQAPEVRARARQIAEQCNQPRVYDSTYAALADVRGCDLWTADERFYNGVRDTLPFVRFAGAY
jgi:predicted nucleic acid-binding protein